MGVIATNGYSVSVWANEKLLEINSGDGYTTLWTCLRLLNCYFKMLKMVNYISHIFYTHIHKKMPGERLKVHLNNLGSKTDMEVRNRAWVSNWEKQKLECTFVCSVQRRSFVKLWSNNKLEFIPWRKHFTPLETHRFKHTTLKSHS